MTASVMNFAPRISAKDINPSFRMIDPSPGLENHTNISNTIQWCFQTKRPFMVIWFTIPPDLIFWSTLWFLSVDGWAS